MKPRLLLIMTFCLCLLMFCSCEDENVSLISENLSSIGYSTTSLMADSPTRIVFGEGTRIHYYNKLDEALYPLCFDPLCAHTSDDCLSRKFMMNGVTQQVEYSLYNNRFYILRGQKLCSFSFDGSDLCIEYSFGEDGDFENRSYSPYSVVQLKIVENEAYMLSADAETGKRDLMCYDLKKEIMYNLTSDIDGDVNDYIVDMESIILTMIHEDEISFWQTDRKEKHLCPLELNIDPYILGRVVGNGEDYYAVNSAYVLQNGETVHLCDEIVKWNVESNMIESIYTVTDGKECKLLAVTTDAIYFQIPENIYIGYKQGIVQKINIYNSQSKVYRLDLASNEMSIVFDDICCSVNEICFIGDDKVLMQGAECIADEGNAKNLAAVFLAELDEDGSFVNVRKLEVNK